LRHLLILLALCIGSSTVNASDHIDGPVTKTTAVADLTDLYAFPANDGKSLAIVLNAYPIVPSDGHFSSKVSYAIVIRKADIQDDGGRAGFVTSDELRIRCDFEDDHEEEHSVTCEAGSGLKATTGSDEVSSAGDFRLFFGQRSDPFFFDAEWSTLVSSEGELPPPSKENSMSSLNVLTLALELDRATLFGGEFNLLAVAAEAYERKPDGGVGRRLDGVGRPEITNVSLVAHGEEDDLRDSYNEGDPFSDSDANAERYRARLVKNIVEHYDGLDGETDWDEAGTTRLATVLLDDYLVVDMAMPCEGNAYLEIERSLLASKPHETCGGRKPTDDVMDRIYTIYINNDKRAALGDGIDQPDKEISDTFPYLAEPATGLWAWIKTLLANRQVDR